MKTEYRSTEQYRDNIVGTIDKDFQKNRYVFLFRFFKTWKSVKMHGYENAMVRGMLVDLREILHFFFNRMKSLQFGFDGNDLTFDGHRIKGHRKNDAYFYDLQELFISLSISKIVFTDMPDERDLLNFFTIIKPFITETRYSSNKCSEIHAEIMNSLENVEIYPSFGDQKITILEEYTTYQRFRDIYRYLVTEYKYLSAYADRDEIMPIKSLKKYIQQMISISIEIKNTQETSYLMMLATTQNLHGQYRACHAVNTAVLSALTALELGCKAPEARTVAIAAYLHSIVADGEVIEDLKQEHGKNVRSFLMLSRMERFNITRIESSIVSSGHFANISTTNINKSPSEVLTFSEKVIDVCDFYDSVTRYWPENEAHNKTVVGRATALKSLIEYANEGYVDRTVVRAFIRVVGIIPPGTIMELQQEKQYAVSVSSQKNNSDVVTVQVFTEDFEFIEQRVVALNQLTTFSKLPPPLPSHAFLSVLDNLELRK